MPTDFGDPFNFDHAKCCNCRMSTGLCSMQHWTVCAWLPSMWRCKRLS